MTRYSVFTGVSSPCQTGLSLLPAHLCTLDPLQGLSPSIHSIDQIKVVDRFRGLPCLFFSAHVIYLPVSRVRDTARRANG